jgi:hypothetical protein
MGNFTIVITGTGSHHGGNDFDADAIAKLFVAALITKGHIDRPREHHVQLAPGHPAHRRRDRLVAGERGRAALMAGIGMPGAPKTPEEIAAAAGFPLAGAVPPQPSIPKDVLAPGAPVPMKMSAAGTTEIIPGATDWIMKLIGGMLPSRSATAQPMPTQTPGSNVRSWIRVPRAPCRTHPRCRRSTHRSRPERPRRSRPGTSASARTWVWSRRP